MEPPFIKTSSYATVDICVTVWCTVAKTILYVILTSANWCHLISPMQVKQQALGAVTHVPALHLGSLLLMLKGRYAYILWVVSVHSPVSCPTTMVVLRNPVSHKTLAGGWSSSMKGVAKIVSYQNFSIVIIHECVNYCCGKHLLSLCH